MQIRGYNQGGRVYRVPMGGAKDFWELLTYVCGGILTYLQVRRTEVKHNHYTHFLEGKQTLEYDYHI